MGLGCDPPARGRAKPGSRYALLAVRIPEQLSRGRAAVWAGGAELGVGNWGCRRSGTGARFGAGPGAELSGVLLFPKWSTPTGPRAAGAQSRPARTDGRHATGARGALERVSLSW